jgi:hypothetical protein
MTNNNTLLKFFQISLRQKIVAIAMPITPSNLTTPLKGLVITPASEHLHCGADDDAAGQPVCQSNVSYYIYWPARDFSVSTVGSATAETPYCQTGV